MRVVAILTAAMLALAASAAGCEDDNPCTPAAQVACACPGRGEGVQVCLEDGSGFGPCEGCAASGGGGPGGAGGAGDAGGAGGAGGAGSAGGAPTCGDGVVSSPEECEESDLQGQTCATLLGAGAIGALACSVSCAFDTAGCCLPDCSGKECGPDGCGQTCGSCSGNQTCTNGHCVCTPDCSGKSCGPDGCGQTCGSCSGNQTCTNGHCVCTPNCSGKECGPDGCGGLCGVCSAPETCAGGQCSCAPSCAGKECGPNGCGGSCGQCSGNETCQAQQCTACAHACPALQPVSLPPNQSGCTPSSDDCNQCGGPACGALHYAYTCGGTPTGGVYNPPEIAGCQRNPSYANVYCCPVATCVHYPAWDVGCQAATGLPVGRFCHPEAQAPPGCVSYGGALCCPS